MIQHYVVINKSMSNKLLDGLIKDLDSLNQQNTIKVVVPSSGEEVEFSLFNVSQHKDLMKTAFDGYEGVVKSSCVYNNIIANNSSVDYDFSLADKTYIIVQLRKESLGDKYDAGNDAVYSLNDLPEPQHDFKYEDTLEYKDITVNLKIPTLKRDTAVSNKLLNELSRFTDKQKETELINTALTYEIIKFIKSIQIGENTLEFDEFNLNDSKKLVSMLPLKLNNLIIEWIADFRKKEESNIKFDDEVMVEIDASFLISD